MNMDQSKVSDSDKITSAMISFINQHIQSAQLDSVDEIILSYVVTVLENLASEIGMGPLEDAFDVEEFCEMLTAYFPEFSSIPQDIVSKWVFDLVDSLRKNNNKDTGKRPLDLESIFCELEQEERKSGHLRSKQNSESSVDSYTSSNGDKKSGKTRTPRVSETSESSDSDVLDILQRLKICQIDIEEKINTLLEMFPTLQRADAQNFIALSNGDLEKSVQMALVHMENEESEPRTSFLARGRNTQCGSKQKEVDEKTMRDNIVARYGFIDQAEDKKHYRPLLPKEEPKKLLRYREGQVVSTKGERYTEVRITKNGEEPFKNYISKPRRHN